jgi:hypothetical protein
MVSPIKAVVFEEIVAGEFVTAGTARDGAEGSDFSTDPTGPLPGCCLLECNQRKTKLIIVASATAMTMLLENFTV